MSALPRPLLWLLSFVPVGGSLLACNMIAGNFERELEDGYAPITHASADAPTAEADSDAPAEEDTSSTDGGGAIAHTGADAAPDGDAGRCGQGPTVFEDPSTAHCYELFTTGKTWTEAEAACVANGGHLAALTSDAERQLVSTALGAGAPNMWIGASDRAAEGSFTWSTGEPFGPAPWIPGEPNNDGDEDCVNVKPGAGWRWNDGECGETVAYLCER